MSQVVSYSRYGGPEVLEIIEVPDPHPAEGQVRVAVRAAGLNPFDFKVRRGGYIPSHQLPSRQGAEFAGVIDEVGDGVDQWKVGDEVLGWVGRGAQAEHVVVAATTLASKPSDLDWAVAGGIGLVGNTAVRETDALQLTTDDTVLVTGAAGGVGLLASQLALRSGAAVIGTASESNHEFLRSLGVIPVSYGEGELERLRAAAPHGFTAALDHRGGAAIQTALDLDIPASRINTIADHDAATRLGLSDVGGGKKNAQELADLANLAASGKLILPIRSTYPLAEIVAAYQDLESGHGLGKIVLLIS